MICAGRPASKRVLGGAQCTRLYTTVRITIACGGTLSLFLHCVCVLINNVSARMVVKPQLLAEICLQQVLISALIYKCRKCRLLAAQRGHCNTVVRLLQASADALARVPSTGETALGLAAQAGKLPSLEALVAAGADLVRAVRGYAC